ncbi:DUF3107 domain-containing protein [Corynebacterium pelargi]|uniref:Uncharacterized protein n=1 Tax=Corynebacterium pelargi TaxID=1471400 RepID=A0A410WAC6_9CORY|nr:DUF3107 domain-containing protein [Corynebacterium pelargi]QAU52907.1 hypothetical protein CPELA_08260 [Corynebacterium pelargi]GGG76105.1 hypothetical protein GCM10007338_12270 [Corynebacterium pelargi]
MDIKIGFNDSPRELIIASKEDQEAIAQRVSEALSAEHGVLDLTDEQGRRVLVRNASIAYVEVGTSTTRTVGFAGV